MLSSLHKRIFSRDRPCFLLESLIKDQRQKTMISLVELVMYSNRTEWSRPFAAKPSRDLLFIKLWAIAKQMPEMEKACREYQNGQI